MNKVSIKWTAAWALQPERGYTFRLGGTFYVSLFNIGSLHIVKQESII